MSKTIVLRFVSFVAFSLFAVCTIQSSEKRIHRNLAYTDPPDDARRLDVYAPAEGEDLPVVVWIHGGGWRQGDKAAVQQKPEAFNEKGYVFVSINYRFVPDVAVGEQAGDVASAVRWVRDHAKEHRGSPDKLIVTGHSAGAHLAALVCTDMSYLKKAGVPADAIKACVPVDTAAYDVPSQVKSIGRVRARLYVGVFGEDEKRQRASSPIGHVARDAGIPPFLILHVADRADSTRQSRAFADRLKSAGVSASIFAAENKTHATINRELGGEGDKPTAAVFEFLKSALKPVTR